MKYYIKREGKTYGPVEESKIRTYLASGFFTPRCLVSTDRREWLPLPQCIAVLRTPDAPKLTGAAAPPPASSAVPRPQPVRPDVVPQTFPIPPAEISRSGGMGWKGVVGILAILLLLLLGGAGTYFYWSRYVQRPAAEDFQKVCQLYQSVVGVVTVSLEDSKGKPLSFKDGDLKVESDYPIGTAFAIDRNKFATNCHVAYGIKDQKSGVLEQVLWHIVLKSALENNVKTKEEFLRYCSKNEKSIKEFRAYLHANVKVRNVEIRLAHSGGRSLNVTGIQVHPRYQPDPEADFAFKNGEFDVAILTTAESVDRYFKIAPPAKLHTLAPGQKIAYLGFPMEGLADNGNLDLNRPEAIFKSGTINKITDFNNVFSTPEFNKSIIHDIPAAGGASGSPIFLPNGEVVAILWGVTHSGKNSQGRIASAAQHNMAVRIDSLEVVKQQTEHNLQTWLGDTKK